MPFALDKHKEFGGELKSVSNTIHRLTMQLSRQYPSEIFDMLDNIRVEVDRFRYKMESELIKEQSDYNRKDGIY